MSFRSFQAGLDQRTLELLTEVHDELWAAIQASGDNVADEDAAREMIGRQIITAAIKLSARDPEALKKTVRGALTH